MEGKIKGNVTEIFGSYFGDVYINTDDGHQYEIAQDELESTIVQAINNYGRLVKESERLTKALELIAYESSHSWIDLDSAIDDASKLLNQLKEQQNEQAKK